MREINLCTNSAALHNAMRSGHVNKHKVEPIQARKKRRQQSGEMEEETPNIWRKKQWQRAPCLGLLPFNQAEFLSLLGESKV